MTQARASAPAVQYARRVADLEAVLAALQGPGVTLVDAEAVVPESPGLYAIHGGPSVWRELQLGEPPDARPLYVGKAEQSLAARDLRTHFGDGRTGSSTVRRSFAALLKEPLALRAQPRNMAKPERPANFGLPEGQDQRLTAWMRRNLRIAVWPSAGDERLRTIERRIVLKWEPPLNLTDVVTPWTATVKAARAVLAAEARAWMKS